MIGADGGLAGILSADRVGEVLTPPEEEAQDIAEQKEAAE